MFVTDGDCHILASGLQPRGASRPLHRRLVKGAYHLALDSVAARVGVAVLKRVLPTEHVELTRHDIAVPGLPGGLEGLRILHVSDLHLRPGSQLAREVPELVAGVEHDLTLYTGDFIDDDDGIDPVARVLAGMPREKPAYAVLGNHDYMPLGRGHGRNDVRRLAAALHGAGIELLCNAALPICGGELFIVGVDDPSIGRDDVDRAMAAVPDGACCLMLAHSPDVVLRLGQHRPGLILAGHTHGGQLRLPLLGPAITMSSVPRRLAMGLHDYHGIPLFVTRGIGYSGLDLRLGCPAEVALLTLRSALAAERAA